jgi:hypothetical protein
MTSHATVPHISQEYGEQKTKRALTLVKINGRKTAYQPAGAVNDPVQKRKPESCNH